MKILVTGAGGQLARELLCYCENIYPFKKEELDITNRDQCEEVYNRIKPDLIIHCAAYTKVDDAENKKSEAYRVNYHGTVHLADLTKQNNSKLCFISTDYVFDGEKSSPYFETDYTNPVNFYGVSKRDAEDYIQNNVPNHYIVRTSWLYGKVGNNFVKTMIKLANINQTIRVVDDQVGSPTNANDLAYFIIQLIKTDKYGIYHATNGGECSWFDFAKHVFKQMNIHSSLVPIKSIDYQTAAKRPKYSVLDNGKLKAEGFKQLDHWKEALDRFLSTLK